MLRCGMDTRRWFVLLVALLVACMVSGCVISPPGVGNDDGSDSGSNGGGPSGDASGDGGSSGQPQAGHTTVEQDAFDRVNQRRVADGGTALTPAADLVQVARAYSERMAAEGFFAHEDPDGNGPDDRVTAAGIAWATVGENLAMNQGFADPAATAAEGWFNSAGHYANIVNAGYEESGMGAAQAADGTWYFAQLFLTRP